MIDLAFAVALLAIVVVVPAPQPGKALMTLAMAGLTILRAVEVLA